MNKTIAELVKEKGIPVELVCTEVQQVMGSDGYIKVKGHKFVTSDIYITSIRPWDKYFYLNFKDEKSAYESSVVVPPDFMLKMPSSERAKELIEKYERAVIKNMGSELFYDGKIGSDPEIFVEGPEGVVVPAFEFLGSKEVPTVSDYYNASYMGATANKLYWDGFQAEFTTDANSCMGWHGDSLHSGMKGIYNAMKKFNPNAKLSAKTVMDIPPELLQKSLPEHVAFGCHPSLNAYGMDGLKAHGQSVPYRSAGGHIHFGFGSKKSDEVIVKMVKALDAILGVACVSMFAKFDDPRRRIMYGLAGEYRLPPHGMEYRVLSNAWLFHPLISNIVFDLARTVTCFGARDLLKYWESTESEVIEIINTCDVTRARAILKQNENLLLKILDVRYHNPKCAQYAYKVIINGMESVLKDATDIAGNWNMNDAWKTHCDSAGKNVMRIITNGDEDKKV